MPQHSESAAMRLMLTPPLCYTPPHLLKWVGSKRRLAPIIVAKILELLGPNGRYFEPFLGSAAVYFRLRAHGIFVKAFLSDRLSPLIGCLKALAHDPEAVDAALREREGCREEWDYYAVRYAFNLARRLSHREDCPVQAARFLYLNHLGFNGLWRQNLKGEHSVPWGGVRTESLPSPALLRSASRALQGAELRACDFAEAIREAGRGDVIYADPPYFGMYNDYAGRFGDADHSRLARALRAARERGASVIASNRDHPRVRVLYPAHLFTAQTLELPHNVGGRAGREEKARELLLIAPGKT